MITMLVFFVFTLYMQLVAEFAAVVAQDEMSDTFVAQWQFWSPRVLSYCKMEETRDRLSHVKANDVEDGELLCACTCTLIMWTLFLDYLACLIFEALTALLDMRKKNASQHILHSITVSTCIQL